MCRDCFNKRGMVECYYCGGDDFARDCTPNKGNRSCGKGNTKGKGKNKRTRSVETTVGTGRSSVYDRQCHACEVWNARRQIYAWWHEESIRLGTNAGQEWIKFNCNPREELYFIKRGHTSPNRSWAHSGTRHCGQNQGECVCPRPARCSLQ